MKLSFSKYFFIYFLLTALTIIFSCSKGGEKVSGDEFLKFEKVDSHVHLNTDSLTFLNIAEADNFKILTINTDVPYFPPIQEQQRLADIQRQSHPEMVYYATTFSMVGWEDNDWAERTIAYLEDSFVKGAIAVKVWKNIGMEFKDKTGKLVMIDDPRFDPVFRFLAEKKIPVIGHLGEPKNCWLPVEKMTVNNDKKYFKNHPEYHMFLHPELPSYEDQINARDHLLEKNPDLIFVGAHLGSMEWSVDEIAARLEKFPNMTVDMAARICHLQYQSAKDYERVRNFIIHYQDRLLYATDMEIDGTEMADTLTKQVNERWLSDWKYFVTKDTMNVPEVNGNFRGLSLPRTVLEKIYYKNAQRWLGIK